MNQQAPSKGLTTLAAALAVGIALSVAGCDRQVPSAETPASPTTTVGTDIDDTVVTTKIKSALLNDSDIKAFDIKAETRKGMVQLSGFVNNQAQADRAMAVARAVEGVKGVENGMDLKEGKAATVGNKVDDSIVTAKVKSTLLSDPGVKSADIGVVTRKGEVQLSGFVDNQAQIDLALKITRAVDGVQTVANEMSIKK
jgi:hyperosmotically inducible protein